MDFQAVRRRYVEKTPVAYIEEYRDPEPDFPGNVQKQLLSRLVAFGVAGPHPTRASDGTISIYRRADAWTQCRETRAR